MLISRSGRRHQIRVHLQSVGHPIANDPLYGGSRSPLIEAPQPGEGPTAEEYERLRKEVGWEIDPDCPDCQDRRLAAGVQRIWLHSFEYSGFLTDPTKSWTFTTPYPSWATL